MPTDLLALDREISRRIFADPKDQMIVILSVRRVKAMAFDPVEAAKEAASAR